MTTTTVGKPRGCCYAWIMGADASPFERTILVVDDDHVQARATVRLLKIAGFDAVPAPDIESAMTELTHRPIHVMLVDLQLGSEHGGDLVTMARRDYPALTTILISGSAPDEVEPVAKACGATAFLTKPFDLDRLLEIIDGSG